MELVLVRDLCGTFCFSMQFVVFIDLIGTLVLPAAIAFTIYVSKYPLSLIYPLLPHLARPPVSSSPPAC
jgi:chitin synthase